MDLARGVNDEHATGVDDGGGAAVGFPDVRADGGGDEGDQVVAALLFILAGLLGVDRGGVRLLEGALSTATPLPGLGGLLDIELWADEVGDDHD